MSTTSQLQFRCTQTPSKVLHLQNLPWECTEEELIELCEPFGKIVNTKCNVGANLNQAFVEFVDLNQAISMMSYYASSSEPAQLRGKTVYIQYSNRQEIVNSKSHGDIVGNVLLVTIEGAEAVDVSLEVIYMVFSAFGPVKKIATFEKAAGYQALIQYSKTEFASNAKIVLDGRSIPRYLLPAHISSCILRISFSAHTDLNIKSQSYCSRDYTNGCLPIEGLSQEPKSNVLLASMRNVQYPVTVDVLHTVFSKFGSVQKIAIFEKNGRTHALIQYPDVTTAAVAKLSLQDQCVHGTCYCQLHLTYSRHTDLNLKAYSSDRSRDYTIPDAKLLGVPQPPGVPSSAPGWQGDPQSAPMYASSSTATMPDGQPRAWDSSFHASAYTLPSSSAASMVPMPPHIPQYGSQPDALYGGAASVGQPPLHYS